MNKRGVLVVAFHYPPDNASTGVLRTLKFTQYLLQHGWRSHVLSVPTSLYGSVDESSTRLVPSEVAVHRVSAVDIKSAVSFRGTYPSALAFPDRYWPWLFAGVRKGTELIRGGGIEAVYTTYPVPTAHMIGLRLKRRFGLPWLADFRDPWVESSMPPVRRWAEGRLERRVMEHADRVICNTPAMRSYFLDRYPDVPPSKFVTITNGYDEPDFAGIDPLKADCFHMVYPGLISAGNRNPEPLFAAMRYAIDRNWLDESDLKLTFLGSGSYATGSRFQEALDRYRLRRVVDVVVERIPYAQALRQLAGADVLVVISESLADNAAEQEWTRLQVPAKVYEYLRLGRPMLALVTEGAVSDVLRATGAGIPLSGNDTAKVAEALRDLYSRRGVTAESSGRAVSSAVGSYRREDLTRLLAAELDHLCGAGTQHPQG